MTESLDTSVVPETAAEAPLAGLSVLELGEWIAAPFAAKLLADLGARVTKVEWAGGDPTRRWGPFPPGREGDPNYSGQFAYLNSSKLGWHLEPMAPEQFAEIVTTAACQVDVLIVDQHFLNRLPPRFVDDMLEVDPSLVVLTVTPLGLDGPHAEHVAYDINCAARGGLAYGVGERDRPPLPLPLNQSEHHAGLTAAIAVLYALHARQRDGAGQHVDHSIVEALASLHAGFFLPLYVYGGGIVGCRNGRENAVASYPNGVLPCADGLVALSSPKAEQWLRFVDLMGTPEWSKQPRYRKRRAMATEYRDESDALMTAWTSQYTKRELFDAFLSRRIPSAPLMTGGDLLDNHHLAERGALVAIDFPAGGSFVAPRGPLRFGRSDYRPGPAPMVRSSDGALRTAPSPPPEPGRAPAPATEPEPDPALAGLRVLDLGTAWAGGLAGRFLGDFGADVIKVESWSHMDGSRMGRPLLVDDADGGDQGRWPDLQAGFHVHSRSKRSITLNLKMARAREIVLELARSADVVIHNFPRPVVERLGLGADVLLEANPRLVVVGQSVAGGSGPASDYTGYAPTVAALAGLAHAVGYEGEVPIGSFQGLYCDVISALVSTLGVMAALYERERSGSGQEVDVSQWEGAMALAAESIVAASTCGSDVASVGFFHPLLAPHGMYPTDPSDEDDRQAAWISIAAGSDGEWRALYDTAKLMDQLGAGARQWSLDARRANASAIDQAVAAWTRTRARHAAQQELQGNGVPAEAVQSIADMLTDAQLEHRQTFVYLEHPLVGVEPMPGLPWRLSRTPGRVVKPAPSLGADTRSVLIDELGLSAAEFDELVAAGVVEVGPINEPARQKVPTQAAQEGTPA